MRKMMPVKYYGYGTGQSYIRIPVKYAKDLGLKHLDELNLEIRIIEGHRSFVLTPIKKNHDKKNADSQGDGPEKTN